MGAAGQVNRRGRSRRPPPHSPPHLNVFVHGAWARFWAGVVAAADAGRDGSGHCSAARPVQRGRELVGGGVPRLLGALAQRVRAPARRQERGRECVPNRRATTRHSRPSGPRACPHMRDPWAVLGVRRDASDADIKRAFRAASLKAHPDAGGSAAAFAELVAAYEAATKPQGARQAGGARSQGASPYNYQHGAGFRPPPPRPRRPSFSLLFGLFRAVRSRSTRADAVFHGALAVAVLGGGAAAALGGDAAWRAANRGKLFEDVVEARARRKGEG